MDPRIRWTLIGIAIGVAALAYKQWFPRINFAVGALLRWFWGICLDEKTCRVAETFLTEAAVLWAVFPLLDSLYEPARRVEPVLWQSYILAGGCLLGAVIISHARKDG